MSTAPAAGTATTALPLSLDAAALTRRIPGRRGLNPTMLRIEALRTLRNRGALIFAVVMPIAFFVMFGRNGAYTDLPYGHATWGAQIMTGMALYGALISATSAGAAVSIERASGWSRQLRLTPLSPTAYVVLKAFAGMLMGAVSIVAVYLVGFGTGIRLAASDWLLTGLTAWFGSAIFAAFGLFMGYLLKSDNAMKFIGPGIALMAFFGGLFMPLESMGEAMRAIAPYTPMYGIHQLAETPYGGDDFGWGAVVNVVVWLTAFVGGAAFLMGRDTARV